MRRKTITVKVGNLILSSDQPVMIQSMLNTSTMDVEACVAQAIRIIEAGGQLVRITAPGVREAEKLKEIHDALRAKGYQTPISADIHFTPDAALIAARYVEKVRINPGNFVDKRATFQHLEYTDEEYVAELNVLHKKFTDFLRVCKQYGTAVRIGTNHGSLSDRIMSRYGDTPEGMVESTMEYLRVCRSENFDDVVISLKSSDCRVMVDAVRLLVRQMKLEGMRYPLHLGVTEAGEGEDGRIRSAVGIGTLLNEGIGDTIRVSLTEEPEAEIPVARALAELCGKPEFERSGDVLKGKCNRPMLVGELLDGMASSDEKLRQVWGFEEQPDSEVKGKRQWQSSRKSPEMIFVEHTCAALSLLPDETTLIVPRRLLDEGKIYHSRVLPLYTLAEFLEEAGEAREKTGFVELSAVGEWEEDLVNSLKQNEQIGIVLSFVPEYASYREIFRQIQSTGLVNPVILRLRLAGRDAEHIALWAASQVGGIFLDRLADGLWIGTPDLLQAGYALELGRNILQSAGVRRYKAEFISCPGCGRTLFDLQGAVARVKAAFGHLSSLKIAVMGCVVNGPGEMGDADYGYVGAGNGKVNLYKGRQIVRTAVPEDQAIEALQDLINAESALILKR